LVGSSASSSGESEELTTQIVNRKGNPKSSGARTKEPLVGRCRAHGQRGGFRHAFLEVNGCVLRDPNSRPIRIFSCTSALVGAPQILKSPRTTIREQGEDVGQGHTAPEAGGEDKGSR
jgi:hypothetical protein